MAKGFSDYYTLVTFTMKIQKEIEKHFLNSFLQVLDLKKKSSIISLHGYFRSVSVVILPLVSEMFELEHECHI